MSRRQGWCGSKNEFTNSCTICAHHHGKAVLMIPWPWGGQGYAGSQHPSELRNQDSPWRCFNTFTSDQEVDHLVCYPMTFMQQAFLAVIAMSLFSPVLGTFLSYVVGISWAIPSVRFSIRVAGLVWGFLQLFQPLLLSDRCCSFLGISRTVYKSFMEEIGTAILMSTGLAVSLSSW